MSPTNKDLQDMVATVDVAPAFRRLPTRPVQSVVSEHLR